MVRIHKSLKNLKFKPRLGAWLPQFSGQSSRCASLILVLVSYLIDPREISHHRDLPDEMYSGPASLAPEQTLAEFISTSAAYHGVLEQPLRTLEAELLKVRS